MRIPWSAVEQAAELIGATIERETGSQVAIISHPLFYDMQYSSNRCFLHILTTALRANIYSPDKIRDHIDWNPKVIRDGDYEYYDHDQSDSSLAAIMSRVWRSRDLTNDD